MGKQYLRKNHRGRLFALLINLPTSPQAQRTATLSHYQINFMQTCLLSYWAQAFGNLRSLKARSLCFFYSNPTSTELCWVRSSPLWMVPCRRCHTSTFLSLHQVLPPPALQSPAFPKAGTGQPSSLRSQPEWSGWQWGLETPCWICCLPSSHVLRAPSWYDFQLPS